VPAEPPGLGAEEFPRSQAKGQDAAEYEEQRARAVSQLYVAMTRARDGLFVLGSHEPSPVLVPALGRFELLET
jgi:ATP-dependent exoDNAse (exonuclease V) beta subunit